MSGTSFLFGVDLHYMVPLVSILPIFHTPISLLSTNEMQGVHVKVKPLLQIYESNSLGLGSNTELTVKSYADKAPIPQGTLHVFYCIVVIQVTVTVIDGAVLDLSKILA